MDIPLQPSRRRAYDSERAPGDPLAGGLAGSIQKNPNWPRELRWCTPFSEAVFPTTKVIIACNHSGNDMYRYSTSCKDGCSNGSSCFEPHAISNLTRRNQSDAVRMQVLEKHRNPSIMEFCHMSL